MVKTIGLVPKADKTPPKEKTTKTEAPKTEAPKTDKAPSEGK